MITIYHKTSKEKKPQIIQEFKNGSWIHVENPTDEELQHLAETHSLELGSLKDATDFYEVPRIEIEKDVTYVFARYPMGEAATIITAPVLIAIGRGFLLTISQKPLPMLEKFISGDIDFSTNQETKLLIQLFFQVNAAYTSFINRISRRIRSTSIQLDIINNRDIMRFVRFESILNDFMSALVPTSAMLQNLLSRRFLNLREEDEDLVEDLFLNIGQLIDICKSNLKSIVNIRESHSTIMTNNLNRVMKLLTSITIILTVNTMIASLYGMNVSLPFQTSPHAFSSIIGLTIGISIVLLLIFTKNRWL